MNDLINTISPLDNRYFDQVKELSEYFSEMSFYKYRLRIEIKYLLFLKDNTNIMNNFDTRKISLINGITQNFNLNDYDRLKYYEKLTNHDVKSLEYFIREKLAGLQLFEISGYVHLGLTSEDTDNLAYSLLLTDFINSVFLVYIKNLLNILDQLCEINKNSVMIAKTHGQPAVPTTFGKELAVYLYRIKKIKRKLENFKLTGKLNGAVGNYNALVFAFFKYDWLKLSQKFVEELGLNWKAVTTQVEGNDSLIELFFDTAALNNILIGLCQDIWLYISEGVLRENIKHSDVGSSTMPQKVNPIDFENAEGNFGISGALFNFFCTKFAKTRWQRDLSDKTVKRNIGVAFEHSLLGIKSLTAGLTKIEFNKKQADKNLLRDWSILAEAVQIYMKAVGVNNSYEKVKKLIRGKTLTPKEFRRIIEKLPLRNPEKNKLKKLTPRKYLGIAEELVDFARKEQ